MTQESVITTHAVVFTQEREIQRSRCLSNDTAADGMPERLALMSSTVDGDCDRCLEPNSGGVPRETTNHGAGVELAPSTAGVL